MTGHTFCCGFGEQAVGQMYDAIAGITAGQVDADEILADLLPIVDRYARAYAAQQVRRIADEHRGGSGEVWIDDLHRAAHNLNPEWLAEEAS